MVRIGELAHEIGRSHATIWRYIKDNRIRYYQNGPGGQNFSERIPCKILDKVHSGQKHSDNLHDLNEWGKVHKQLKKCYPLLNENNGFSLRKSEIYLNSIARNDISRSFPSFLSKTCSAGKEKKTLNNIV